MDVQGVAATASEPSQHLLPATDRGPQGRLAFGRQRARGGRGRQGSSTGPTPDAVDATSDARRAGPPDAVIEAASGSSATTPAAAATK